MKRKICKWCGQDNDLNIDKCKYCGENLSIKLNYEIKDLENKILDVESEENPEIKN